MMNIRTLFAIFFSVVSISSFADNKSLDAAIGGGLGGAAGGYLGSEFGGRTGAIVGSSTGAAIGSAMTTSGSYQNSKYYERDGRYRDYKYDDYPKYRKHKKYKGCPPGLAMQGRC